MIHFFYIQMKFFDIFLNTSAEWWEIVELLGPPLFVLSFLHRVVKRACFLFNMIFI